MKKETIFHEFDCVIYPRKIWISNRALKEEIEEEFIPDQEYIDGGFGDDEFTGTLATCYPVVKKDVNKKGILCNLSSSPDVQVISHESVHIADYVFEDLGMCAQGFKEKNEPYAYFVGWVADCFAKIYER
jgi:hypothetical protein